MSENPNLSKTCGGKIDYVNIDIIAGGRANFENIAHVKWGNLDDRLIEEVIDDFVLYIDSARNMRVGGANCALRLVVEDNSGRLLVDRVFRDFSEYSEFSKDWISTVDPEEALYMGIYLEMVELVNGDAAWLSTSEDLHLPSAFLSKREMVRLVKRLAEVQKKRKERCIELVGSLEDPDDADCLLELISPYLLSVFENLEARGWRISGVTWLDERWREGPLAISLESDAPFDVPLPPGFNRSRVLNQVMWTSGTDALLGGKDYLTEDDRDRIAKDFENLRVWSEALRVKRP